MKDRISVFIFVDAYGWEIMSGRPILEDICPYRYRTRMVFGYSSTAIPSILSGKLPKDHGHFSFFFYSPKTSPFQDLKFLRFVPRFFSSRHKFRNLVSKIAKKRYGFTGYFHLYNVPFEYLPLFDYCEKTDLYEPGGMAPTKTIFDHLEDLGVPYHRSDWRASEITNIRSLLQALKERRVRFAYLYTAALDGLLHMHGTASDIIAEKIKWYDEQFRRVYEEAVRQYKEVRIVVFSDHGMNDIVESHDLMGEINRLGLTFGEDFVAVYDSTMARFWFLRDGVREKISECLARIPYGRIVPNEELDQLGVFTPDYKFGEMFFLLDGGHLIVPSFMGEKPLAGMHGYHPDDPQSYAMAMSSWELASPPRQVNEMFNVLLSEARAAAR